MRKTPLMFVLATVLLCATARGNQILIDLTNQVWRYNQSGTDLTDTGWEFPNYDDSLWPEGRGIFAYETVPSMTLSNTVFPYTNTVLTLGPVAFYFRTHFAFSGDPATVALAVSNLVDDGFVLYLNGAKVAEYNMNLAGTIAARANPEGEGVYWVTNLCFPPDLLLNGDNVLAVAVFQNSPMSTDVVWGTVLHASSGYLPRILWPSNTMNIALLEGRSSNLVVSVDAGPCATYRWFLNETEIPGATGLTYTIADMDAFKAGVYFAKVVNQFGSATSPTFILSLVTDTQPPIVTSARSDDGDPALVTVIFSEEVVGAADRFSYFLESTGFPSETIAVSNVVYGASSNVVLLTLERSRSAGTTYSLIIVTHNIQDRYGNLLDDPTLVSVSVPSMFREGLNGYAGTQDTEIEQDAPFTNHGQDPTVNCDDSPRRQGLLRFESFIGGGPGQIPLGVVITDATLRLYTDDPVLGTNTPIRMLRMLAPWNEQSFWDSLANGIDQTNGVETGVTDALITAPTDNSFVEIDVTAAVQAWVNGQPNHGWAFLATGGDGWRWASSEHFTLAQRPALIIDYWYEPPLCSIVEQPRSQTVPEGESFTLSVVSFGSDLRYQWFKNGVLITNATTASYSVPWSRPADSGNYYVRVYNGLAECISQIATITICCAPPPPQLVSAIGNPDQTTIALKFSSILDPLTAGNPDNYSISGGLRIVGAVHNGRDVTLTTSGPRQPLNYTLTIENVRDNYAAANVIFPNPTVASLTQDVRILSFNAIWKYWDIGTDLGSTWSGWQFDDSAWPLGMGLLGNETTEATLNLLSNQNLFMQTLISRTNHITDYFRTMVSIPFAVHGVTFTIRHVTDDGAAFYLNGRELGRFNLPEGTLNHLTPTVMPQAEGVVRAITNLTGLLCGWNLVAAEVHQQSLANADVLFGAEIIARVPVFIAAHCEPGLSIKLNADQTVTLSWTPNAILEQTDHLTGQWTTAPPSPNPLHIPAPNGSRFYRLRQF